MKYVAYLWGGVIFCAVLVIVLLLKVFSLENQVRSLREGKSPALTALQDSLPRLQADLAMVKETAPGLGEYMTTIQLHAGKLWFAAKAANWELAEYELDELKETMETARGLKRREKRGENFECSGFGASEPGCRVR
jgi:hypothetical protein